MAWELIATAPQDGTHILGYGTISFGGQRIFVQQEIWMAWTETYSYSPVPDGHYERIVTKVDQHWEPSSQSFNPTHWMPLPRKPV
jgi:hypothetical protein